MAVDPSVERTAIAGNKPIGNCTLCGLPARATILLDDLDHSSPVFCCFGCRNVWQILIESDQLKPGQSPVDLPVYKQALAMGLVSCPETSEKPLDNKTPNLPSKVWQDGTASVDDVRDCSITVDNMWCASCAWFIGESLKRLPGVETATVSFASDNARVTYKPARIGREQIIETINKLGYAASDSALSSDVDTKRNNAKRNEIIRCVIAAAFAMNVMMLTPNIYASDFAGGDKFIHSFMPWVLLLLSLPVYICAWPVFARAVIALRRGALIMESLVSLGASVAFAFSLWCVIHGSVRSYFDTADMLLALVMVGKLVESNMRANALGAIELLHLTIPKKANILIPSENGSLTERVVAIAQIAKGDLLRVRSGDVIIADGTVQSGSGGVDEGLLTGESRPVSKSVGDKVTGGSTVVSGFLDILVNRASDSGTLSNIVDLVQRSLHKKTQNEQAADRISRIFVPVVIVLAIGTFGGLLYLHASAADAITRAVAVLVIACPCALGIATPMAVVAAVAAAAKRGIIISDPEALEASTKITDVIFDKTGTLTEGKFKILEVYPNDAVLDSIRKLESLSEHPIARAICGDSKIDGSGISNYRRIEGCGVTGDIDGINYFAGNLALLEHLNIDVPSNLLSATNLWQEQAASSAFAWTASISL